MQVQLILNKAQNEWEAKFKEIISGSWHCELVNSLERSVVYRSWSPREINMEHKMELFAMVSEFMTF